MTIAASPHRVLVIGAGVTGASLTHYLGGSKFRVTCWEKSPAPGGRFSTVRRPGSAIVDDGAQYITRGAGSGAPDRALYEELLSRGVIQPFTGVVAGARGNHEEQEHFVCRDGMSSVCQHLLTGAEVEYERCAAELLCAEPNLWRVTDTQGQTQEFDAVVVTAPPPELLEMRGAALQTLLEPHREALSRVASRYSQRFAARAYYDASAWPAFEALPWDTRYVKPGETTAGSLVYVSVEPRKRQTAGATPPAVLLHSSVPFGFKHADVPPEEVLRTLLDDWASLAPGLPAPVHAEVRRWRLSQVPPPEAELKGQTGVVPGAEDGAMLLRADGLPPLVLAGDGLVGSNFDNCAASGRAAAAKLLSLAAAA